MKLADPQQSERDEDGREGCRVDEKDSARAAMRTPPMAGPIIRALLKEVEFSPTAFGRSASPTSSDTKDWRAGASKAEAHPSRNAKT
jgi:hypothetical protein